MTLKKFLVLMLLAAISLTGCGYTTASLLPKEMNSIHIANFSNRIDPTREVSDRRMSYTYRPGLENQITRAVIDGFIFDRHLDVKSRSAAVLLLEGELTDLRLYPLSYDRSDNVEELRVELTVDLSLYDNRTGELLWKAKDFTGWASYHVTGPNALSDAEGIKNAVSDLTRRIVERVVENW